MRVMVCDTDDQKQVNALYRYSYYGTPKSNEDFRFEPGALAYPLLLATVDNLDADAYLPAVYKRFDKEYEVCDTRFKRDSAGRLADRLTLREALSITSNVAMVNVLDKHYGHRRGELIQRMGALFGESVELPKTMDTDSAWYGLLQGRGFFVSMETLLNCYHKLPSQIKEILPQAEDRSGIVGIPSLVVQESGRENAMFIGIDYEGRIGLIIFEGSKVHPEMLEKIFVSLSTNKPIKI